MILIIALLAILHPHPASARQRPTNGPRCEIDGDFSKIRCSHIGLSERALDEILEGLVASNATQTYAFDDMAAGVETIRIDVPQGNVTITESGLAKLRSLKRLEIVGCTPPQYYLVITTPKLIWIDVTGFWFAQENVYMVTVHFSASDHMGNPKQRNDQTNYIIPLTGMCTEEPLPHPRFTEKEAAKVTAVSTTDCEVMPNITRNSFSGMTNVENLKWSRNGVVDFEPGAFDDLQRLKTLDLSQNRIRQIIRQVDQSDQSRFEWQ